MDTNSKTAPLSFVVAFYAAVFKVLNEFTLFSLLRRAVPSLLRPSRAYTTVEVWVITNTVVALTAALYAYSRPTSLIVSVLLVYGALRVFEIVIVQVNVLFFDQWRSWRAGKPYSVRGYRRTALLLLHNYVELTFWFMTVILYLYHTSHVAVENVAFVDIFRTSLLSMVSFSTADVRALDSWSSVILALQSVVGIFMTLLTLSRFISLIPAPPTMEASEQPFE